jgi:HK97 family phage major capsid protein
VDEKDLKLALNELGDKIDTKLEKYSKELTALTDEKARKAAIEEIKKALEPELSKFQKMQDQIDGIDTKMQRTSADKDLKKSFAELLKEKLGDGGRELKGKTMQFDVKVDDMLQSNSFQSTVVVPYDTQPGIKFEPDRTTHARDIISVGTTNSNVVSFVYEYAESMSTYAAQTSEGNEYKQADFDLKLTTANVVKITAYLIISEEMLEDVEGLQSYILTRLPAKLRNEEDNFVLRDTTYGVIGKATTYVDSFADDDITRFDVLTSALEQVKVYEHSPNFILLHPIDVMKMKLEKDDNGQYLYPWVFTAGRPSIDGVQIFESTCMNAGTFLVGDGRVGAQIFDRRQLSIEFSNTNEDNFIKGMVTVRGSERIAVAVYLAHAFIYGTFSTALAAGSL